MIGLVVEKIVADPGFDIQILVPMIRKHGTRDEELAFRILYRRKTPGDFYDLKDLILDHPDLGKALSEDEWVDQMYFWFWLRALGVDDTIKTKNDLVDWMKKKKTGKRCVDTGSKKEEIDRNVSVFLIVLVKGITDWLVV